MVETYHYPPELYELMVEAIPALIKSKEGVLTFFAGAGVSEALLADLRARLRTDRQGTYKAEIARSVLTGLNQGGDSLLAQRREVLKRVVDWEDYSTCWPADALKAKGLVAEIRRVVNVKDSFTRMKKEREEERRLRQEQYRAEIVKRQERAARISGLRDELFALFSLPQSHSQARGLRFEALLNELFGMDGLLVRESFHVVGDPGAGVVEQIDGAVEIDSHLYLVEAKWWKEPLGVGDISPHLVRVYSREQVGGIYVSQSGYSSAAIAACKDALSQRVVVMCELAEIVDVLTRGEDLIAFWRAKIQGTVTSKNPLFRVTLT